MISFAPRALNIALCLAAWSGASCTRSAHDAAPDPQAITVEHGSSVDGGSSAAPPAPSAEPNAIVSVEAGPCTPTALTSSARLVSDILPCDGACPVYRITLHADGSVEYDGTHAKVTGHHESKLTRKATESLFAQAECATFAVPRAVLHGVGSGVAGPAEAVVTLDVGKGPSTLRALRARTCTISQDPQDRAVCELSYAIDEAVRVDTWVGYLPRNGPPRPTRDH